MELEKKHQKERDEIKSTMTKELNDYSTFSETQQKEELTKLQEQAKTKYQELKHKVNNLLPLARSYFCAEPVRTDCANLRSTLVSKYRVLFQRTVF